MRTVPMFLRKVRSTSTSILRHTYFRELVGSGVDIATVAELAGHADINMTRRYSKPSHDELDHVIEKIFG